MDSVQIRRANIDEGPRLTEIAFGAKRHWGYPEAYFTIWEKELTITPDYIAENIVYAAHQGLQIVGFYSIVRTPAEVMLDHIFLDPSYLRKGIGSRMITHAKNLVKDVADSLLIFADPNAAGFYDRIGAIQIDTVASNIEGRVIPVYRLELKGL